MAHDPIVVLDDRLLVEELLTGLAHKAPPRTLVTTTWWYYRACRAAVLGAGGSLSGPFQALAEPEQEQAILSLLRLRPDIGLADPRQIIPVMAKVSSRHPRLNLLNVEAVAVAEHCHATVWLSEKGSEGILPTVLDAEGLPWSTITLAT